MLSELLLNRATAQKLHGVISHQDNINEEGAFWLERFVTWEERHRSQRSLDGRLRKARIRPLRKLSFS